VKKTSFVVVMLSLVLASCVTKQAVEKTAVVPVTKPAVAYNVNDYYVVYQDGRIYAFDDFKVYQDFLELGETTFRFTRIAAGPKGETVVFGLRKVDKKKPMESGVVNLYDGKAEGIPVGFYGEVVKDGRVYIFSEWADLQSFIKVGEATFRYTDIGAGPKGETLVYVLNKSNKKKKPVALMAVYKAKHR
jgi:hypothetical protein